jgi:hypothetical protein
MRLALYLPGCSAGTEGGAGTIYVVILLTKRVYGRVFNSSMDASIRVWRYELTLTSSEVGRRIPVCNKRIAKITL